MLSFLDPLVLETSALSFYKLQVFSHCTTVVARIRMLSMRAARIYLPLHHSGGKDYNVVLRSSDSTGRPAEASGKLAGATS